jgi:hypothetical protein
MAGIVAGMPEHLEYRSGQVWVVNPTCEQENYADRYVGDIAKAYALKNWLDTVAKDLGTIDRSQGLHVVTKAIDEAFGLGLGSRVARRMGEEATRALADRRLGSNATGLLSTAMSQPHRPHTNFGQSR